MLDGVSAQVGHPVPPPGVPGPFALDDAALLESMLKDAGFSDVTVNEVATPMTAPSFDAWWTRTSSLAGPLAGVLAALPAEAATAVRQRVHELVRPYETADGLDFPGVNLLASARRA
jgi:hypothetical protein